METKYDVFISYSRKDLELVKEIKAEIDRLVGVDCWMDLDGIVRESKGFLRQNQE